MTAVSRLRSLAVLRLRDRLVLFIVALLAVVQLAGFLSIRYVIERSAESTLREEVATAARVARQLLQATDQQRLDATAVIALDYGLRAAIATRDEPTLRSALHNHGERVHASGMFVLDREGRVVADLDAASVVGRTYPDENLVARALDEGSAIGMRIADGRVRRVVAVSVKTPLPTAVVASEWALDESMARTTQALSSADVSFVLSGDGTTRVLASTLAPSRQRQLAAEAKRILASGTTGLKVELGDASYQTLALALPDTSRLRIYAVLQRSSADQQAAYVALQAALLIIGAIALAITLAGSIRIARTITRPVGEMAAAARKVARGNYDVELPRAGRDEIGELGRAFRAMVHGLVERDTMRDVLGKVASPEVVEELLDGRVALGGEVLDATVMFVDLRDFTPLCQDMAPDASLSLLNEYFGAIGAAVEAHGGVVDKYLGDGVMAVFGAPVTRPDDAQRAVEAALDVRDRVAQLREQLVARGLPAPEIGIGMNTARVVAGNIGTPSRLNYTVLGDGVNLAARLEGLTKKYRVPIIVSDRTRSSVTGFVFRELDKVRVKGRRDAERIWEPLARDGALDAAGIDRLVRWHEALQLFRQRDFACAGDSFRTLADTPGYEQATTVYLEHIEAMREHPPGPDWDAAFTLDTK